MNTREVVWTGFSRGVVRTNSSVVVVVVVAPGSRPIRASGTGDLPAVPFVAHVVGGKLRMHVSPPQTCGA